MSVTWTRYNTHNFIVISQTVWICMKCINYEYNTDISVKIFAISYFSCYSSLVNPSYFIYGLFPTFCSGLACSKGKCC